MDGIYNISAADMLDASKVKVIHGIAGSGKSSTVDRFFKDNSISYMRLTSTNKLKRDAADRYDCDNKTVCSGLFTNADGKFYMEEKDPECKNIVIDEILQTNPKVIDWIAHHVGRYNIIVLTDAHQMLICDGGAHMLQRFQELCKANFTISVELNKTLRARDPETEAYITAMYNADSDKATAYHDDCSNFDMIDYADMSYNMHDIYICHTNDIEDMLYRDKLITSGVYNDCDVIPKGHIASKIPKDLSKYPIMSQKQAERTRSKSYLQMANIGSCTRYQGSECRDDQTLYYIVNAGSKVTNREWYTVISRCWSIKSIKIVIMQQAETKIKMLCGKPVKTAITYAMRGDQPIEGTVTRAQMMELLSGATNPDYYYDRDRIYYNGKLVVVDGTAAATKNKISAGSLLKKESAFDFNFMDSVYQIITGKGIDHVICAHLAKGGTKSTDKYIYQIDMHSAYPHILKYEDMPIDGHIYDSYDPDHINFYIVKSGYIKTGALITDKLNTYITAHGCKTEFCFGTDKQHGSKMGDRLIDMCYKSKKSKQDAKLVHYGYFQKKYIAYNIDEDCYVRYPQYNHELIMAAVSSDLCYMMVTIMDLTNTSGHFLCDALFFDDDHIDDIKACMTDRFPNYDYRIIKNGKPTETDRHGEVLYKSFADLK